MQVTLSQRGMCVCVCVLHRVRNLEEDFYCYATAADLQKEMGLTPKLSSFLYNYWKLKRSVSPRTYNAFIWHTLMLHSSPSQSNQSRPLVAAMSVDSLRLELLQQSHVGHMTHVGHMHVTCRHMIVT